MSASFIPHIACVSCVTLTWKCSLSSYSLDGSVLVISRVISNSQLCVSCSPEYAAGKRVLSKLWSVYHK